MQAPDPIDFIARRRWPVAGCLLALIVGAAACWEAWLALDDADLLRRQRAGLAALQRQPARKVVAMSADDIRRHAQTDAVSRYLAAPWRPLLALFEDQASSGVVLVKFLPDAGSGRVEITGRAPSARALGDYVITLEHDPRLKDVLLHHHEVLRDEPGAGIEFSIGAAWGSASELAAPGAAASAAAS
jgi:Tfp pilus assembly protein PilN